MNTQNSTPSTTGRRAAALVSGLAAATVFAVAAPAAAAPISGQVGGNYCGGRYSWMKETVTTGAYAQLGRDWATASQFSFTPCAFDAASDGLSARNTGSLYQYVGGSWRLTTSWVVTGTAGYGTSGVGAQRTITKVAGATHVKIVMTATRYNSPTGTNYNPVTRTWVLAW